MHSKKNQKDGATHNYPLNVGSYCDHLKSLQAVPTGAGSNPNILRDGLERREQNRVWTESWDQHRKMADMQTTQGNYTFKMGRGRPAEEGE